MTILEGSQLANGMRFAVVVSKYNDFVTDRLQAAALAALAAAGVEDGNVTVLRVPGAFEIPSAARHAAATGGYHAIVCLGCLIRGATPHFEHVASECMHGICAAARTHGMPIGVGVLTVDTIEQAIERAGTKAGNKGEEAALAAIEMVNLLRRLD